MSSNKEGKRAENRDSDPEETDLPTALTEGRSPHWQQIYEEAELLVANAVLETDPFLYNLLHRHFGEMELRPGMNDGETLIYLITRLIDRTNRMATARQAAIHLARSHWDVELAITNYVNPTAYISSEETSDSDDDEVYDPEPAREDIVDDDPDDTETQTAAQINAHIDRKPAVKGKKDASKFEVKLNLTGGGKKIMNFLPFEGGNALDWDNPRHVRDLNRWRSQVIRRNIAPGKPAVINYLPEENDFITQQYTDHRNTHQQQQPNTPVNWNEMDWAAITTEFNRRFAGQVLQPGAAPRPERTRASLQTQRYRIQAVCDMIGRELKTDKMVKSPGKKGGKKDGDGKSGDPGPSK